MNTNEFTQLIQQSPAAWHGITMAHAFVLTAAAWATHANWPKIIQAGTWVAAHGGIMGIAGALLRGKKPVANSQEPIVNSQGK